jgi:hypothetical protein
MTCVNETGKFLALKNKLAQRPFGPRREVCKGFVVPAAAMAVEAGNPICKGSKRAPVTTTESV